MLTRSFRIPLRALMRAALALAVAAGAVVAWADSGALTTSRVIYGDQNASNRLVIGSLTNAPRYNYGQIKPFSLYILEQVRGLGIDAVEVVTTDTHEKMVELLRTGRVDWVAATPYAALVYERDAGAKMFLTKKSRGRGVYRSVFFTRTDSGIETLEDLNGRTIAFEKPGSTSAFFLPAMELLGAGLRLVELDSPRTPAPADAVGYFFSGDEVNSSTWVHKRIADAAAFSNEDWESDWRTPRAFRADMRVFHETTEVPRSIELIGSDVDPLVRSKIRSSLLKLNEQSDAQEILMGYYAASDFTDISAAQMKALSRIRETLEHFEQIMNLPENKATAGVGK